MTQNDCLASRALALPASPIRALLNAPRQGDTLDLGGGHPDPRLFPSSELARAAQRLLCDDRRIALQYAATEGLGELRSWIADRLRHRGLEVMPEQILLTHGSQHALSTLAQVFGEKGRMALLEQPGYPGALQALALAQCRLGALPVTPEGWDSDVALQAQPSLVYVIPHFQNPTGRCASVAEKQALAAQANRQNFFVIEDDAYGEISFDRRLLRPLIADCPERGLLIGSFSKTLCPGLRLGYLVAPRALLPPLVKTLQATTLQPGTLAQHLAWSLLQDLDYDAHLAQLCRLYQKRAQRLSTRFWEMGLANTPPEGGFFLWVPTPGQAGDVSRRAAERGLLAVPESAFRAPGMHGPDRHLRLAFPRYEDDASSSTRLKHALSTENVL